MAFGSESTIAEPVSVLFVCLGNICRSPMAEGVFQHITKPDSESHHPLIGRIDSCGTAAYHVGEPPDSRTMSTLEDNGITTYRHSARKFDTSDFTEFNYIFAMDNDNLRHLQRLRQNRLRERSLQDSDLGKVMLWGEFGGKKGEEVADPYYGGRDGFEIAYEQMVRFTGGFLKFLENKKSE